MKTNSHRFLCALCALTVFISALFPASAFAAQAADTVAQTTLTTADAREMQQADSAVTALTGSDAYAEMTRAQRLDAAVAQRRSSWPRKGLFWRALSMWTKKTAWSALPTAAARWAAFWWRTRTKRILPSPSPNCPLWICTKCPTLRRGSGQRHDLLRL